MLDPEPHIDTAEADCRETDGDKPQKSSLFLPSHLKCIFVIKSESSLNGVEVAVLLVDQLSVVVDKVER